MALAVVVSTGGSTYSKAGACMLIADNGDYQGLLSGGCVEGDLAEHAARAIRDRVTALVEYDLGGEEDALWGLGVGCDGAMRILLVPLHAGDGYAPFAAVAAAYARDEPSVLALQARADLRELAGAVATPADAEAFGLSDAAGRRVAADASARLAARESGYGVIDLDGNGREFVFAWIAPPPALLLLGAGPDARPLADFAAVLGWRLSVYDHRPAYLERGGFDQARRAVSGPADALAETMPLAEFDAAVVMSHHLRTDEAYLQQLAAVDIPYVGLLGPPHRRERLLDSIGAAAEPLAPRLHGPAGIDIGGRDPESIALSIIAQAHEVLAAARRI